MAAWLSIAPLVLAMCLGIWMTIERFKKRSGERTMYLVKDEHER